MLPDPQGLQQFTEKIKSEIRASNVYVHDEINEFMKEGMCSLSSHMKS